MSETPDNDVPIAIDPGQKAKILSRLNSLVPLLTTLVAVLGLVISSGYNIWNAHNTEANSRYDQWRSALEKVGFSQAELLPSAYLMESFSDSKQFGQQARTIETSLLERSNDGPTFDAMYYGMLMDTTASNEKDILQLDSELSLELEALYRKAIEGAANKPPTHSSFKSYLIDPAAFYNPGTSGYNRTLILIYDLDTISSGLKCAWVQNPKMQCRGQLSPDDQDMRGVILVNSGGFDKSLFGRDKVKPTIATTCTVRVSNFDPEKPIMICESPDDNN